ncbi:hypothetical protein PIB30_058239 [Stylosanthes scabra]|uniref:Uncharacterized protein n=1 Tax=Stylosanthes scabra TaxID=79078 RepID=A0ABU6VKX6_9FABA|nr:hypothetical protein [Stylosanthes scabra]
MEDVDLPTRPFGRVWLRGAAVSPTPVGRRTPPPLGHSSLSITPSSLCACARVVLGAPLLCCRRTPLLGAPASTPLLPASSARARAPLFLPLQHTPLPPPFRLSQSCLTASVSASATPPPLQLRRRLQPGLLGRASIAALLGSSIGNVGSGTGSSIGGFQI